jgi:hypothetical protein
MEKKIKYNLVIVSHNIGKDFVEYIMQLINSNQPNNIIEFRERYSNLLNLHYILLKESGSNNFPKFPPKRIFGNMKEDFVLEREKDLKTYFQKIFENQEFYKLKSLQNWIDNIIKNNKPKNQKEENIKNNNIIIDKYKKKEEEYIDTHFIDFFDFDNTDDENIGKPLKDENTINQIEFNSNIFLIPEGDDRNFDLIQQENQIIQYEDLLIDNLNLFINIINNKKLLYYENNNNLIDSFKI